MPMPLEERHGTVAFTTDAEIIAAAGVKMFSRQPPRFDRLLDCKHAEVNELARKRNSILRLNQATPKLLSVTLPKYPIFCTTPSPESSNVGTALIVHAYHALGPIDPIVGTHHSAVDAMLEYICDYANKSHSAMESVDRHSPGADPVFFPLNSRFLADLDAVGARSLAAQVSKRLGIEQFWSLRYLFIPIQYAALSPGNLGHIALLVISPEAKTLDLLCSSGDSDISRVNPGHAIIKKVLEWLIAFLHQDIDRQFKPWEWRMRTDASEIQHPDSNDCAQYVVTNAMYLAFGYGINYHGITFPRGHQNQMETRRRRIATDMMMGGLKDNERIGEFAEGEQYYPILDTPSTAWAKDGWRALDRSIIEELDPEK